VPVLAPVLHVQVVRTAQTMGTTVRTPSANDAYDGEQSSRPEEWMVISRRASEPGGRSSEYMHGAPGAGNYNGGVSVWGVRGTGVGVGDSAGSEPAAATAC
jgi:hypothetical protein